MILIGGSHGDKGAISLLTGDLHYRTWSFGKVLYDESPVASTWRYPDWFQLYVCLA